MGRYIQRKKNIRPNFEVWDKDTSEFPPGYHMIFDVKMGKTFRRKAQFFADGHKIKTPAATTYPLVMSKESVRIALNQ